MTGGAAICFVLANPAKERPLDSLDRRIRLLLSRIPVIWRAIPPRWSPARRMGYAAGLRACVQSLRRKHAKLPPIVLLRPDDGLTLADVDDVISFDTAPYESIPFTRSYYGREIYYKLETFNLRQFERIVYLDCDTVVLDDISRLWDMNEYAEKGFYAVRETKEMGADLPVIGKFNTGVMVLNPQMLAENAHQWMLGIARSTKSYDSGDQGVINRYFEQMNESAGELDVEYNVMVSIKKNGDWNKVVRNRIRILHYVNFIKPWADGHDRDLFFDPDFKRIWDEAYEVRGKPYLPPIGTTS